MATSHKHLPHDKDLRPENVEVKKKALSKPIRTYTAVALSSGEFSVHHSHLIHASAGNQGKEMRIALAIRYAGSQNTSQPQISFGNPLKDIPIVWRSVEK